MLGRIIVVLCIGLGFLGGVAAWCWIDWYALGSAVPPGSQELIVLDWAEVDQFLINTSKELVAEVEIRSDEHLASLATIRMQTKDWAWNPPLSIATQGLSAIKRFHDQQSERPIATLRLDMVCRSWFGNGERVAKSVSSNCRRQDDKLATWIAEWRAPDRPGIYELRIVLSRRYRRSRGVIVAKSQAGQEERIIGVYRVKVLPKDR